MEKTKSQIKEYIAKNILFSANGFTYTDETSFLEEGIVDSLSIMELIVYVEENFNVSIEDHDITPSNFDSINKMAAYIHTKSVNPV